MGMRQLRLRRMVEILLIVGTTLVLSACGGVRVSRVATDTTTDLSGRWNDTDSRLVAQEMVGEALSRPWLERIVAQRGKNPTVIVGTVVNSSQEELGI